VAQTERPSCWQPDQPICCTGARELSYENGKAIDIAIDQRH